MPTTKRRRPQSRKSHRAFPSKHAIRDWKSYVVQFTDGTYYAGITSRKNAGRRIAQHGGGKGARWARGKKVARIVQTHHLSRMSRMRAENLENDITLTLRKRFGYRKVRGGYNAYVKPSFIPNYTPGSMESVVFILASIAIAGLLLVVIIVV